MFNINDLLKRVEKQKFVLTKFLDSEESSMLRKIKSHDIKIYFNGGYDSFERCRAILIDSSFEEPTIDDFEIKALDIKLNSLNRPVTHRHVLGTLMGLGIKRETIGDILINKDRITLFVVSEMVNFIKNNLIDINQNSISITETSISELIIEDNSIDKTINIASMRLDALVSRCQNVSRNISNDIITKGLVRVNHIDCLNPSYIIKINDLISIRHFGRVLVKEIVTTTKKDRLVVLVNIRH